MVMYRTVIWKDPANIQALPDGIDKTTWENEQLANKDDFETNYMASVGTVLEHGYDPGTDIELDYAAFKQKITDLGLTWDSVLMVNNTVAYWLYLEV